MSKELIERLKSCELNHQEDLLESLCRRWHEFPHELEACINSLHQEELMYVSKTAFESSSHSCLFVMLAKQNVAPFDTDCDDERVWREFRDDLLSKDCMVIASSLRFFREDGFEYLWQDKVDVLLDLIDNVCEDPSLLGGFARIVWNLSSDDVRPGNVVRLLKCVWERYALSRESATAERVKCYLQALKTHNVGQLFKDKTDLSAHALKNLLRESLQMGSFSRNDATWCFCDELSMDPRSLFQNQ
eukprot:TRINITY_DN9216_c0_g1_i1.p1 TRINITY_DN9216_c0_g1~~TRINITY_DN9216_c0_g1_i1.p1  ORF type:complete len:245 (+),score=61.54 TRINITY_DN9216_c0_g1_i1:267-1001(+)